MLTKYPVNTGRSSKADSMLGQRRRHWPNIESTLGERLVFAGYTLKVLITLIVDCF